jgi:transposase
VAKRPARSRGSGTEEKEPTPAPVAPLPADAWDFLPSDVQHHIKSLRERLIQLETENTDLREKLRSALAQDSSNSHRPSSTDSPFRKAARARTAMGPHRRPGARPGHPRHRRPKLPPTSVEHVVPIVCTHCGHSHLSDPTPYDEHQVVELPPVQLLVTLLLLCQATCPACGKVTKAVPPPQQITGYGPRLSAFLTLMMGPDGISRRALQRLCASVLKLPISLGALQKIDTRGSHAIQAHHEAIGALVQTAPVCHLDETTFAQQRHLHWLWIMATRTEAYFRLLPSRSKLAFQTVIGSWRGRLVADAYGTYRSWPNDRQSCLAHPLRRAKALSESTDPEIAAFGTKLRRELRRLVHMKRAPPTVGVWGAWLARFMGLLRAHQNRNDDAGKLARHLLREDEALWAFLIHPDMDPTNNHGERQIRPGVQWRKRRQGTRNQTGATRVERGLTLYQTCRLRDASVYDVLVDAFEALLAKCAPDLSWLAPCTSPLQPTAPTPPA